MATLHKKKQLITKRMKTFHAKPKPVPKKTTSESVKGFFGSVFAGAKKVGAGLETMRNSPGFQQFGENLASAHGIKTQKKKR